MEKEGYNKFETTSWSLVEQVRNGSDEAMEKICAQYWPPIYSFAISLGCPAVEAKDMTQEFFAHAIGTRLWQSVDPEKGRLRDLLRGAFRRVYSKHRQYAGAQKRGGHSTSFSINADEMELTYLKEMQNTQDPEKAYEMVWAMSLFNAAMILLEDYYIKGGKQAIFEALKGRLIGDRDQKYDEIAAGLGMNVDAVRTEKHRMRKKFYEIFRNEVRKTVTNEEEIDIEITYIISLLAQ